MGLITDSGVEMKLFKVKISEYTLTGRAERWIEVEAKNTESAVNKVSRIAGNRVWDVLEIRSADSLVCK